MPSNRTFGRQQRIQVTEEVSIAVALALSSLLKQASGEYTFPSSLNSNERAYVHSEAAALGLKSRSRGKGHARRVTVTKRPVEVTEMRRISFALSWNSRRAIAQMAQHCPLTDKERADLSPRTDKTHGQMKNLQFTTGRLMGIVPQVPQPRRPTELSQSAQRLPVWERRDEIIRLINERQVVLISGDPGTGKTTQVPQMILDDCAANQRKCRIVCAQPRRLAAVANAERVAAELGEKVGETVGFHIRLESKVSPKTTLLAFCTTGILLRTLSADPHRSFVRQTTHVIIDEIHERDRLADFLLVCLRDLLAQHAHLRLILMSANMQTDLFQSYFPDCPLISVPNRTYPVQDFYLDEILDMTGYRGGAAAVAATRAAANAAAAAAEVALEHWCGSGEKNCVANSDDLESTFASLSVANVNNTSKVFDLADQDSDLAYSSEESAAAAAEFDQLLSRAWTSNDRAALDRAVTLIRSGLVPIDRPHSDTGATALMVAAGRGFIGCIDALLTCLRANPLFRAPNGWCAVDWADKFGHERAVALINAHTAANSIAEEAIDCRVDCELVVRLLQTIHQTYPMPSDRRSGAVLIFVPGFEDIMSLYQMIRQSNLSFARVAMLFVLHSQLKLDDQKAVFRPSPPDRRKVILATNIAETSLTIDDVSFVVDTGLAKEKWLDASTGVVTFQCAWIAQSSANQRRGRCGRCSPGVCFHLYTRQRHAAMQPYPLPEISRYPLEELCLQSRLLVPTPDLTTGCGASAGTSACSIADFLAKTLEPPPAENVLASVTLLKEMDALDTFEDLTELGLHLCDLPIEPRLAKMVLIGVILKCIDPVLTIAAILSYREPFIIPTEPGKRSAAVAVRRKFSVDTHSDHMSLLRAFQQWQRARSEGWEANFCDRNYISGAAFEMILGIRSQLLGQLRASTFVKTKGSGDVRDLNTNSENWAVVKAALVAGSYPNLAKVDRERRRLYSRSVHCVRFHPQSVLSPGPQESHAMAVDQLPSDWLVYNEAVRSGGGRIAHIRCATLVSPAAVLLFAGSARLPADYVAKLERSLANPNGGDSNTGDKHRQQHHRHQRQAGTDEAAAGDNFGEANDGLDDFADNENDIYDCDDDNDGDDEFEDYDEDLLDDENGGCGDANTATSSDQVGRQQQRRPLALSVDRWIRVRSDPESLSCLLQLRLKFSALLLRRVRNPAKLLSYQDEAVLKTLVNVLTYEEQALGLRQPAGVGAKPRQIGAADSLFRPPAVADDDCARSSSPPQPTPPPPPPIQPATLTTQLHLSLSPTVSTAASRMSSIEIAPTPPQPMQQQHQQQQLPSHSQPQQSLPPVASQQQQQQQVPRSKRYFLLPVSSPGLWSLAQTRCTLPVSPTLERRLSSALSDVSSSVGASGSAGPGSGVLLLILFTRRPELSTDSVASSAPSSMLGLARLRSVVQSDQDGSSRACFDWLHQQQRATNHIDDQQQQQLNHADITRDSGSGIELPIAEAERLLNMFSLGGALSQASSQAALAASRTTTACAQQQQHEQQQQQQLFTSRSAAAVTAPAIASRVAHGNFHQQSHHHQLIQQQQQHQVPMWLQTASGQRMLVAASTNVNLIQQQPQQQQQQQQQQQYNDARLYLAAAANLQMRAAAAAAAAAAATSTGTLNQQPQQQQQLLLLQQQLQAHAQAQGQQQQNTLVAIMAALQQQQQPPQNHFSK